MRPAGDRADPADLPGRPDVDRAAVALRARRLRHRGLSAAGRAGRLDHGVDRADRRGATVGGDRRRRLVRPGAAGRHRVVRLGAGDAAGRDVSRPARSRRWPTPASRSPRSRRGARGATRRCACAPRRICSPATSTGPLSLFAESSALAAAMSNTDYVRRQRVRARAVGDGSRAMGGGGRARGACARRHRGASDARLRHQRARLRRRGPARDAPRRPRRRRTASSPGRCEPGRHARSRCRTSPCGYGCNWPRCTAPWATTTTARHLLREIDDVLLHRPALGALVDEVDGVPPDPHLERAGGSDRRVTPHPGGASAAAVPADAPHDPRDRQSGCSSPATPSAPRSARSTGSSGVSSRSDAVQQATAVGLLGG